jgi:hypothetical protein
MEPVEYAPTYSTAERLRFIALGVTLGVIVTALGKLLFFPWLTHFAATASCRVVLGANAATVLWYALFVGLPLLGAFVVGLGYVRTGLSVVRKSQFPPPGIKTFRPIRIVRGVAARRIGYLHLVAVAPFLAVAIWGYAQASSLASHHSAAAKCAANNSFKPNPLRGSA